MRLNDLIGGVPGARLAGRSDGAPDIAAIRFTPAEAFSQTPGPNAGQALLVHA